MTIDKFTEITNSKFYLYKGVAEISYRGDSMSRQGKKVNVKKLHFYEEI